MGGAARNRWQAVRQLRYSRRGLRFECLQLAGSRLGGDSSALVTTAIADVTSMPSVVSVGTVATAGVSIQT